MENVNQQLMAILSQPQFLFPFILWSIFWKGLALWQAASRRHLVWFLILLIVNTMGLLEIGYIVYFHKWDIDNGKVLAYLQRNFGKKKSSG